MATPRTAAQTGAAAPMFGALLAAARAPAYGRRMDTDPGFDTLAYAQRLKAAGVEDKQAEAHAAAACDSQAGLAMKTDLDNLEARLTLAWAQRLKAAGVEDKQAEAHAAAARDSQAGLATKADLEHLATKADLANLEARFSRAMVVLTVAFAGIVGVTVKFL